MVSADYVVQYHGQALQLDRAARGRVPAKSTVLVRETEDGRLRVFHIGRDGQARRCQWTPAVARAAPPVVAAPPHPTPTRSTMCDRIIRGTGNTACGWPRRGNTAERRRPPYPPPGNPWRTQSPRDISIRSPQGTLLSALDNWPPVDLARRARHPILQWSPAHCLSCPLGAGVVFIAGPRVSNPRSWRPEASSRRQLHRARPAPI